MAYKGPAYNKKNNSSYEGPAKRVGLIRKVGLGTFYDDLEAMNGTVSNITSSWQTPETMSNSRYSVSQMYDRLGAYEELRKSGYYGSELPDLSDVHGAYKSVLDGWDDTAYYYSGYKDAVSFNAAKEYSESLHNANIADLDKDIAYHEDIKNKKFMKHPDEYLTADYGKKNLMDYIPQDARDKFVNVNPQDAPAPWWETDKSFSTEELQRNLRNYSFEISKNIEDTIKKPISIDRHILPEQSKNTELFESMGNTVKGLVEDKPEIALQSDRDLLYNEAYEKYLAEYGLSPDTIDDVIGEKKRFRTEAARVQEWDKLSGVANPESEYYDKNYDAYVEKGKAIHYEDVGSMNLRNGASGMPVPEYDDTRAAAMALYEHNGGELDKYEKSRDNVKKFRRFTDEEFDVLAYYIAYDQENGTDLTSEFLKSKEDTLNYRHGQEWAKAVEGNLFLQYGTKAIAGVDQFTSGIANNFSDEEYFATSASSYASQRIDYDLRGVDIPIWYNFAEGEWEDKIAGRNLAQIGGDMIQTTANMAPSILTSWAVGLVNPGAGAVVGASLMGGSARGNAYTEMINQGYSKSQASTYANLVGASEAGLSYALSGISSLGGKASKGFIQKAVSGIDNGFARFAVKFGGTMASEGIEEGLQEILTPLFKNIAAGYDTGARIDWAEVGYSTLLGALTGGIMEGPSIIQSNARISKISNDIRSSGKLGDLFKIASSLPDGSSSKKLYNQLTGTKHFALENVSSEQIAELYEAVSKDAASSYSKALGDMNRYRQAIDKFKSVRESGTASEAKVGKATANLNSAISAYTDAQKRMGQYDGVLSQIAEVNGAIFASGFQQALAKKEADIKSKFDKAVKKLSSGVETSVIKGSDKAIDIKGIKKGKGNNITIITSDGEVSINDVALSYNDASLIEYAKTFGSDDVANLFLETYDKETNKDIDAYENDFELVSSYAKGSFSQDYILSHKGSLSAEQASAIYGKMVIEQAKQTEAEHDKLIASTANVVSYKGYIDDSIIDYNNTSAKGKVNWSSLNSRQQSAVHFLKAFATKTGMNLVFDPYSDDTNGSFSIKDNTIHVSLNAGIEAHIGKLQDTFMPTASHEITHWMKGKANELYLKLKDKILDSLSEIEGKSQEDIIAKELERLNARHPESEHTAEDAVDEIVARACEDMLSMSKEGRKLFESMTESEKKSFCQKVKEIIGNLMKWIDDFLSSYKSESPEAKALREYKDKLEEISKIWDEMLIRSVEVNQALEKSDVFVHLENGISEDGTTIVGKNNLQMSDKTYRDGGRAFLINWLNGQKGLSDADKQNIIEQTDRVASIMRAIDEGGELPEYSRWANLDVVKDENGDKVLSVIVKNGDYAMNIDFSQVCKKRVALNAVLNKMVQSGDLNVITLSETDVSELNSIIKSHDFEIACALCFVDSKRYRVGAWAESFCEGSDTKEKGKKIHKYGFNEMVRSLIPKGSGINVDEFNFTNRDIKNQPTENLLSEADDSQLDFSLIDSIMANNDAKSAQHRYAKAIKENPDIRKILNKAEIISSIGLDAIRLEAPKLYGLINGHQGTAKPKFSHDNVAYGNDILKASNFTPEKAKMVGGVRCQSFSDFMAVMVVDYAQFISELSAKQLTAHSYTKEPLFVKLFGLTGMKINMSLVPKAIDMTPEQQERFAILKDKNANKRTKAYKDALNEYMTLTENAGLDENGNYIWEDETFPYDIAMEIVVDKRYSKNCGTIAVGISNNHIKKLLADSRISMVIPYHKSGLNREVALMRDIALYNDYTDKQNTRDKKTGKKLDGVPDFDFYGDLYGVDGKEGTHDPKKTAENYRKWCYENNYIPKFDDFMLDENYYKLLIDFRVYDVDGTYTEQQPVQAIYPSNEEFKDLIVNGVVDKDGKVYGGLKQQQANVDRLDAESQQIIDEYKQRLKEKYGDKLQLSEKVTKFTQDDYKHNCKELVHMDSVANLNGTELDGDLPLGEKVKNLFKAWGNVVTTDRFGNVELTESSVHSDIRHGTTRNKVTAYAAIPDVLKSGAVIDTYKKNNGEVERIIVAAPITISNIPYFMGVMIQRDINTNRLYLHDVVIKKEASEYQTQHLNTTGTVDSENLLMTEVLEKAISVGLIVSRNEEENNGKIVNNGKVQYSDKDSNGRQLSDGQIEYFKDSKVRDENGNLRIMYHGTPNGSFNEFRLSDGTHSSLMAAYGAGYYFDSVEASAKRYTKNVNKSGVATNPKVYKAYLNITNPLMITDGNITISKEQLAQITSKGNYEWFFTDGMPFELRKKLGKTKDEIQSLPRGEVINHWAEMITERAYSDADILSAVVKAYKGDSILSVMKEVLGHDGAVYKDRYGEIWVAWNSNQIKYTDNINPTMNDDIRYSDKGSTSTYDMMGEKKRLMEENEQFKAEIERLNERLKIEKQVTHGKVFNENSLGAVARHIRKIANSNYDTVKLMREIKDVYSYIVESPQVYWEDLYSKCYEVATGVLAESKPEVEVDHAYKQILKQIKETRIYLDEQQKSEAQYLFGKNWNRSFLGKVTITNDAKTSLDEQWQEWSELYPEWFDADVSPNEQVSKLMDVIGNMRDASEIVMEYDSQEQARWLALEIYNQYWNVSTITTTADKYQKKLHALRAAHRQMMDKQRDSYKVRMKSKLETQKNLDAMYYGRKLLEKDKAIARQRLADDIYYGKLIHRLKVEKEKQADRLKAQGKERLDSYKERAEKKAHLKRIQANCLTMNEWLMKNSKDKHISEEMKGPVIALLNAIDFSSNRMLEEGVPTKADISLAKALSKVKDMMVEATSSVDTYLDLHGHGLDDDIKKMLESVDNIVSTFGDNEFVLQKMSLDDLITLDKVVKVIKSAVTKMNKFHIAKHAEGVASLSQESVKYLDELGIGKIYSGIRGVISSSLNWNNTLPFYAFKRFGPGAMKIFTAFQDGWDKLAFNSKLCIDYANATYTAKEVQEWSKEVKEFEVLKPATEEDMLKKDFVPKVQKIQMTVPQLMSLYCLGKREQARGHLFSGGLRIADFEVKKGEIIRQPNGAILTEKDLSTMLDSLTERQKEVADKLQEFLNTVCSEWGNEVSMARFGYLAFGEENYFPIKSDDNNLKTDTQNENNLYKLLNMSFTKALTQGANNKIIISDIFDVFAQHSSDMVKYNAMALPVLDALKWYNYTEKQEAGEGTHETHGVKAAIETAFGTDGKKYFDTFLKDINGQQESDREKLPSTMLKKFKVASVGANLRVMALQPTAYLRASAVIDNKYLVKALGFKDKAMGGSIKKAEKYCGIALWKSMGYYDTNIQRSIAEQIKHDEKWMDKAIEKSLKGAEKMDKLTWGLLWNACELEIRDKRKDLNVGSEEFYTEIGKRLRDVIYATQVVDSTLTRSQTMRSTKLADKIVTNFASEPTLAYNMVLDLITETKLFARQKGITFAQAVLKNKSKIGRVLVAYTATNIASSLIAAAFDAFRGDDEDKDMEVFMRNWCSTFLKEQSVTGKIPYIKEIYSIFEGFSSSRSELAWMESSYKAIKGIAAIASGDGNINTTFKHTSKAFSYITGLPLYNAYREITSGIKIFTGEELEEMFQ